MQRYHNLDFLRAFAMLLGLAVHAPLIYYYPDVALELGIENIPEPELWVWLMLGFITSWRMPLFFLLAGFFAILVIQKRGPLRFLGDRTVRIGMTLLLFAFLYDYIDGRLDFTLGHLWFLYYLLFFCVIVVFLYHFSHFKRLYSNPLSPVLLLFIASCLILTVPLAGLLNANWDPYTFLSPPERYGDIKIGNIVYYLTYFLAGTVLYANQKIFTLIARNKPLLSIALVATVVMVFQLLMETDFWLYLILKGMNSLFWCLLFLGLATKMILFRNAILDWLVELSYPIYLFHVFAIIVFSGELFKAGYDQVEVILLSIVFGFVSSVIMYYLFVKFTPISWLINGYHKSYLKFNLRKI
ncbi:MAG: acyltransferase family protein [Rhodobacteraceae bacterium]|nr:acyltransferase family protein [Paracoccaceae bacterium]